MTKTTNYQLNQWAKSDRIMMDDFNADNQKIDAALKANADAMPRILHGSYTGDGADTRTISLPFTPKAVLITTADGQMCSVQSSHTYLRGGIALQEKPAAHNSAIFISVVTDGFQVYKAQPGTNLHTETNTKNTEYVYIAVG